MPNSYQVNNVTVTVAAPPIVVPDGPTGIPRAIVVSSIVSAVAILMGMALFTM